MKRGETGHHYTGGVGVGGSNPLAPTIFNNLREGFLVLVELGRFFSTTFHLLNGTTLLVWFQVSILHGPSYIEVARQFLNQVNFHTGLDRTRYEIVPQVMPVKIHNPGGVHNLCKLL